LAGAVSLKPAFSICSRRESDMGLGLILVPVGMLHLKSGS
jgi:hypothetical protein